MRAHRLRRPPSRARPQHAGLRPARPLSALDGTGRHSGVQHHRHRRQDHQPGGRRGLDRTRGGQPLRGHVHRADGPPQRRPPRSTTPGHRVRRPHGRSHWRVGRTGDGLHHRFGRLFRRRSTRRVRRFGGPLGRRPPRGSRGPGRRRRRQGRPTGLRPLEGRQARRTHLGLAVGSGPPRLAHRVRGHVTAPPR